MDKEGDLKRNKVDEQDYDIEDLKNENDYGDECEDGAVKSNRGQDEEDQSADIGESGIRSSRY